MHWETRFADCFTVIRALLRYLEPNPQSLRLSVGQLLQAMMSQNVPGHHQSSLVGLPPLICVVMKSTSYDSALQKYKDVLLL